MTFSATRSRYEYRRWVPLPVRVGERRTDEVGAGPVVELAVGDADDGADLRVRLARRRAGRRDRSPSLPTLPSRSHMGVVTPL